MINKSNNLPSFVKETNLPNIVDKLTDAKNIKISNNKYGNRVQTVIDEIVEKTDNVTKAINQEVTNNSYSFKVGQGNNIDVSTDVVDSFGEVGLKGVTYQNLITNPSRIIRTIDQTGIKYKHFYALGKQNTVYTIILDVYKNTTTSDASNWGIYIDGANYSQDTFIGNTSIGLTKAGFVGRHICKITSNKTTSCTRFSIGMHSDYGSSYEFEADVVLLEGDHTNNPNLPSYFEGIVGVGDKSKNLFNPQKVADDLGLDVVSEGLVVNKLIGNRLYIDSITPKPNTVYHISIQEYLPITTNGTWSPIIGLEYTDGTSHESYTYTGLTFLTSSAKSVHRFYIRNPWPNVIGCWKNVHIVESKISTPYEPYYDGHKIEILSRPNLANISTSGRTNFEVGHIRKDKTYSLKFNREDKSVKYNLMYSFGGSNRKMALTNLSNEFVTFASTETCILYINSYKEVNITEIMLVEGIYSEETMPSFKSYQEDKTQILLDEPLMRLPNGVADEITRDGKLIRRVDKVILDGSRRWNLGTTSSGWKYGDTLPFYYSPDKADIDKKNNGYSLTDRFQTSIGATIVGSDVESFSLGHSNYITIRLNKSRLATEDAKGFIKWLQQNPTTVYYELETPIITDIIPPSLRIFKDGHLFNTLVAPESSHVVQLNKSGQIQNAIKESQSLDNRISVLENNYDNLMLSTISRLNDLELDYTLK